MAPRVSGRRARPPRQRENSEGYFYAHEAAKLLGADAIDYAQLRRLYRVARPAMATVLGKKWARFSFLDLVAMRVAFELAGGVHALQKGKRLRLGSVERACREMRERFGVQEPLTQTKMWREGRRIIAQVGGVRFDAGSGQVQLILEDLKNNFALLTTLGASRSPLVAKFSAEEKALRTSDSRVLKATVRLEVGT